MYELSQEDREACIKALKIIRKICTADVACNNCPFIVPVDWRGDEQCYLHRTYPNEYVFVDEIDPKQILI